MRSLGFGIERLGLIALYRPWWTLGVLVALTAFSIVGLFSLQPEGRLSEVYRGNSVNYQNYDKVSKLFPTSELDLLVLLTGKDMLTRDKIEKLRQIEDDLEKADGVASTLSMLSFNGKPKDEGEAPLLFPKDLSKKTDEEFRDILKDIEDHPDVLGEMLSKKDKDGNQTNLLILTLKDDAVLGSNLNEVLEKLRARTEALATPAGFKVELAGIPFIQQEIRNTINHDAIFFNLGGVLVGVLLSFYFIRKPIFILMTSTASIMANIWVLGTLGHFGQAMNAFITVVPPLIMVITVSDGTHMVLDIFKRLREGDTKEQALLHTIYSIGPACVLTSLTTTIALLSMTITDSAVIRAFGLTAALGTLSAFIAVILVLPTLTMLMIRDESKYRADSEKMRKHPLLKLEHFSEKMAEKVVPRWRSLTLLCLLIGGLFTTLYFQLQPRYSLNDEMPDKPELTSAINLIDDKLGGSNYIHVLVSYPKDKTATSPEVLEAIGEAHRLLGNLDEINEVSSIEKTRLWFKSNGIDDPERLKTFLDDMDPLMKRRLLNEAEHAAIVNGKILSLSADQNRLLADKITAILDNMKQEYPQLNFTVSGLSTLAAQQSISIISQLNNGLLLAILVVVAIIGIAFRSVEDALLSIVPNLFPIAAAGALLFLLDEGLQYASILGLTVAFGLAVDDTIHFLNRYHLEKQRSNNLVDIVRNSVSHIGTVLVLTTLILICGLAVTIFSNLSMTRLFGNLSIATLLAALVADLLFLPAIIIAMIKGKQALIRGWYAMWHPDSVIFPPSDQLGLVATEPLSMRLEKLKAEDESGSGGGSDSDGSSFGSDCVRSSDTDKAAEYKAASSKAKEGKPPKQPTSDAKQAKDTAPEPGEANSGNGSANDHNVSKDDNKKDRISPQVASNLSKAARRRMKRKNRRA